MTLDEIKTCMGEHPIDTETLNHIDAIDTLTEYMSDTSRIILTAYLYGYTIGSGRTIERIDKRAANL